MKKKKLLWIVFAVLLMAVCGCGKKEVAQEPVKIYAGMGEIEYVEFSDRRTTGILIKQEDIWSWDHSTKLVLNQETVAEELKDLCQVTAVEHIKKEESLDAYGLENPEYTLIIKDTDGQTKTLYIGSEAGDDVCYAAVDGKDTVYTLSEEVVEYWDELLEQKVYREQLDALSAPTKKQ